MSFDGAEIPAWGMFALAVIYIAFQFLLKWQEAQAKKAATRNGHKDPAAILVEHEATLKEMTVQLAAITGALGGITTVLRTLAQETNELHVIHLGPKALDDDNRPKWWTDRAALKRISDAMTEMNQRMTRLELRRGSSRESVQGLARPRSSKSNT